jgi:hypothetical protein
MTLSKRARLLAHNPSLRPDYLFDEQSNPDELSAQFKMLSWEAHHMPSQLQQKTIDKMMPIVGILENGHFVAVAQCDTPGCGTESRWTCEAVPRDHKVVFTKFRDRKWHANKRGLTCPKCVARKKQKPVTEFQREPTMKPLAAALQTAVEHEIQPLSERPQPILAEVETIMPETQTAPTDKAKAAKRQAYALLLDHYDEVNKRYNGEWSDIKIAGLVKMSEAFVAKIREDDFGPAGPPPQLIDLKARVTSLETKLLQKEQLVLQAMDTLPEMQQELSLLKDQLQSLIRAHGWAP